MERAPILILMPDQFRADCLSCAGHPVVRTPHVDRLAAEGVRFTHCFTSSPLCMPARASFLSGHYPHNHGIWRNAGQLPAEAETLFRGLQAAGYCTAHIGEGDYYVQDERHLREHEASMCALGFDYVHEITGAWESLHTPSYLTDYWRDQGKLERFRDDHRKRREAGPCAVWPSALSVEPHLDSYVGRRAVEFIHDYDQPRPFCLFVGFGGPHDPWDAPGSYATMYDPAAMPPALPAAGPEARLTRYAAERMVHGRIPGMSGDDIRRVRANHYGKVALIDH